MDPMVSIMHVYAHMLWQTFYDVALIKTSASVDGEIKGINIKQI